MGLSHQVKGDFIMRLPTEKEIAGSQHWLLSVLTAVNMEGCLPCQNFSHATIEQLQLSINCLVLCCSTEKGNSQKNNNLQHQAYCKYCTVDCRSITALSLGATVWSVSQEAITAMQTVKSNIQEDFVEKQRALKVTVFNLWVYVG